MIKTLPTPKFSNKKANNFHQELKQRVNNYFVENKLSTTGGSRILTKAIILWTMYIAGYIHLVFFTPSVAVSILECIVMGGLTATIGFNVMHDGGHGTFSKNKIINYIAANSVNLLGASALMWHSKHNIIHHTYTNIHGVDDDIEAAANTLRLAPGQDRKWFHKFQHVYAWFLYSLLLISWVLIGDFKKYFKQRIGTVAIKKLSPAEHIGFWAAKIVYAALMFIIPIYRLGFLNWLVGFLIIALTAGVILSVVFQLAHTVEEASFPLPDNVNKMENEWAIHQLHTTANFATNNKVISWLVGGLNFQVEHHLFPRISHIHYPQISKIVKITCSEFNIKYIEFSRMREAIGSHARHLKLMGSAA